MAKQTKKVKIEASQIQANEPEVKVCIWDYQMDKSNNPVEGYNLSKGMSKRFYAACSAMQGLLASQAGQYNVIGGTRASYCEKLVSQSYQFADELLKQEEVQK